MHYYRPKRSFGQGNIFTSVCHSVHRRGGLVPGGFSNFSGRVLQFFGGGVSPPEYSQRSAGTHPTGMHSCYKIPLLQSHGVTRIVCVISDFRIFTVYLSKTGAVRRQFIVKIVKYYNHERYQFKVQPRPRKMNF